MLEYVPSSKTNDELTISHLCGTRNCIIGDHLILEPKRINDERTGCHQYLLNGVKPKDEELYWALVRQELCPHDIQCLHIHPGVIGAQHKDSPVEYKEF